MDKLENFDDVVSIEIASGSRACWELAWFLVGGELQ